MNLNCLTDVITKRLGIHIDVSNINSWNLNEAYTSVSLNRWKGAISDDKTLLDFGLTAFDNGRVDSMTDSGETFVGDTQVRLYRVGYNTETGGTFYDTFTITPITGETIGTYFDLNGGYLQGYFKLQGETYEAFPARYGEGITIENLIKTDSGTTDGIFYLMGARAEDKYNPYFSGETLPVLTEETINVKTGILGETQSYTVTTTGFTGITTSEGNYLHAFLDTAQQKAAFQQFEEKNEIVPLQQPQDSVYDNVIAFIYYEDGTLGVRRITADGKVKTIYSDNQIPNYGWHLITTTFEPYKIIKDVDELACEPQRKGTLTFYVDGRLFWKIEDYDEFYFRDFKNDDEKVLGVPYNISWGGGSFGLKHSYHWTDFNQTGITQNPETQNLLIEKNFNSSFLGGIQKLRVYDYAFNSQEVLHNAYWENTNNSGLNMNVTKGGRIIYQ